MTLYFIGYVLFEVGLDPNHQLDIDELTGKGTLQCRSQVDLPQTMAAYTHTRLGCGGNLDGRDPKPGWLFRRTVFPRRD